MKVPAGEQGVGESQWGVCGPCSGSRHPCASGEGPSSRRQACLPGGLCSRGPVNSSRQPVCQLSSLPFMLRWLHTPRRSLVNPPLVSPFQVPIRERHEFLADSLLQKLKINKPAGQWAVLMGGALLQAPWGALECARVLTPRTHDGGLIWKSCLIKLQ